MLDSEGVQILLQFFIISELPESLSQVLDSHTQSFASNIVESFPQ